MFCTTKFPLKLMPLKGQHLHHHSGVVVRGQHLQHRSRDVPGEGQCHQCYFGACSVRVSQSLLIRFNKCRLNFFRPFMRIAKVCNSFACLASSLRFGNAFWYKNGETDVRVGEGLALTDHIGVNC